MITLDVPEGGEVLVHDSDAIFDFVGVPLFVVPDDNNDGGSSKIEMGSCCRRRLPPPSTPSLVPLLNRSRFPLRCCPPPPPPPPRIVSTHAMPISANASSFGYVGSAAAADAVDSGRDVRSSNAARVDDDDAVDPPPAEDDFFTSPSPSGRCR